MNLQSRSKAQALIKSESVFCNGKLVQKTGFMVAEQDVVTVQNFDALKYVSRGGFKLEKAINDFNIDFTGKVIMDIGSSTGGFTDCSLQNGASKVIAIDVGKDIMDKTLVADPRIELHEQTDIREFPMERLLNVDYIVCDVSFISLLSIMPFVLSHAGNYSMILLIKPQFECGPKNAKRFKGVVLDKVIHKEVLTRVIGTIESYGFDLKGLTFSPICGGDGNIEYVSYFQRGTGMDLSGVDINYLIAEAFGRLN